MCSGIIDVKDAPSSHGGDPARIGTLAFIHLKSDNRRNTL